jgi:hypothetical protein
MKPKYLIVLNAMEKGVEVELPGGFTYGLGEDGLYIRMIKTFPPPQEFYRYLSDMALNEFMGLCDGLSDEAIALIVANGVLTEGAWS